MQQAVNQQTIARLHLIGTLTIVTLLTVLLGVYFSWRTVQEQQASVERLRHGMNLQQQQRLQTEMDAATSYLQFTRQSTDGRLREELTRQVDTALQAAESIYRLESPRRSSAEVRQLIVETLRPLQFFDGRGYYFAYDMRGNTVLLPHEPGLEGHNRLDYRDDAGRAIVRDLIDAARRPAGEGFVSYRYFAPGSYTVMSDKLSYVRYFAPFDWLIGAGDYVQHWERQQQQQVIEHLRGISFGQSGHISLFDSSGKLLVSHTLTALEDKPAAVPARQQAVLDLLYAKARQGGGMVHYEWPDHRDQWVAKTAMVKLIEPWGWTMVVSMTDDELRATVEQAMVSQDTPTERLRQWLVPLAVALLLGLAASYGFSRWSRQFFSRYEDALQAKNQSIADSAALFRAVFENTAVGMAQVAPDGRFLQVNQRFCKLLGYPREAILDDSFNFQKVTLPEDLASDMHQVRRLLAGQGDDYSREKRYVRQDGSVVWLFLMVHLVRAPHGAPAYFIAAIYDITERKHAEDNLRLAASVFTYAREGIMITDVQGTLVEVNDSFTRITGYTRDEAVGQNPRILKSGLQTDDNYTEMWRSIRDKGHWYGEFWNRRKSGEIYATAQTISVVRDAKGVAQHYVSLFSDVTAIKEHERQLEHIAHFDALTSLPNRVLLADRLSQAMLQAQRRGQMLAVAYLDLDGFKAINDLHGHDAGDHVLMAVASRMKDTLREGDTLARIGGDEFVAVLVDLPDTGACQPLLVRLLAAAAEPLLLGGASLQVSASLGVTFYPQMDAIDADQLQRQADQAMYQAKLAGKNRFHVFDADQDRSARGHFESLEHIRQALQHRELVLYYQPKVNMRSGKVIGAEALIRWQHPERGLLAPAEFLPVIENHPLAVEVGEWVIDTALRQMESWHAQGLDLPISVNVGARQLQQSDFVARLQTLLASHPDVSPCYLALEVLETSALEDIAGVSQVMTACQALGVAFALDDFGTGYSSLTYLKRLPVTLLKIDQSFVRDMLDDEDDLAILKGVIGLAQAFHREVIAEGVETIAHGTALLQLGCELAQGYGIARPMPAADFPAWAAGWLPDAAWQRHNA